MMKRVALILFSAVCALSASARQSERSVSPSRQFVIFGGDDVVRGAVSTAAEQTKSNLLTLLRQRDDWKTPIIVNLQPLRANLPEIPPADLRFSQTGFGIKLQLDLTISRNLDVSLVERELLRAILLEMIYREQSRITAGTVLVEPPDWLIEGVLALSPGRDRGPLIEAITNTDKPVSLENFLRQRRELLGSTGRTLYRAYSLVLVQMLLDVSLVERELLRAILLEMIYREQSRITPGTVLVEPPDWLIEGVLALSPGRDRGPLIEAIANTDKPLPVEDFLRQRRELLGSTGRTLYRAYSLVLVQMLLDETKGESRLAQYIGHLSEASNDSLADLKARFPVLADNADKAWQTALSQLKNVQTFRLLTFTESDQRLDELLQIKITEPNKPAKMVRLDELTQHKPSLSEKIALDQLKRELLFFAPQANPVLRPIAREYQEVATLLARGKRRGMAKRLARLELTRQQLASRMSEIDDYMNWFEATQMKSGSGNFSGYLKAVNQSELPMPRRNDPLSIYIDALEDQFEN